MAQEGIFRFTAFRAPKEKVRRRLTRTRLPLFVSETETDFYRAFLSVAASGNSRGDLLTLAESLKQSPRYVRELRSLPLDLTPLLTWAADNANTPIAGIDFSVVFQTLFGAPLATLVAGEPFRATLGALADTLLADALSARREPHGEDVSLAFKLLSLGELTARGETLPFTGKVGEFVAKVTVAVPSALGPARPLRPAEETLPPRTPISPEDAELRERLRNLAAAHRELTRLVDDERALSSSEEEPDREGSSGTTTRQASAGEVFEGRPLTLTSEAQAALSEETQRVLTDLRVLPGSVDPFRAILLIEDEMKYLGSQLASQHEVATQLLIGGVSIETKKLKQSLGFGESPLPGIQLKQDGCGYAVGVGDLLLVEQKLKAYELAEFAHVENVLAGELREREHRRLHLREDIETTETEREIEKERNLQSTERNELQNEAAKTVKDQFSLQAGLQVSGSYGPTISFSSSLNAAYSTSVEESQKKAQSYSREVTEKAAERTRERVRNELRRRVLEQIEEINRHRIENGTADHVRGIYRWLNKIYDAQVFNYGKRMMFEFVIPEPAAYFLWALVDNPPKDIEIRKPEPPTYKGAPLHPSHLTRTNYLDYVAQYQVANVPPPPAQFQIAAYFDKQDGNSEATYGRSGKIEVPTGYAAKGARVHAAYTFTKDETHVFRIFLGGKIWYASKGTYSVYKSFNSRVKELSIGYLLLNAWSFTVAVDVVCELTPEGLAKWQHAVYDAIIAAYQRQQAEYDEKIAAMKIQRGEQQFGRNPLENRRIERDELKKLAIEMLTGQPHLNIKSVYTFGQNAEPVMNLEAACKNGSYIRFFENAFEWNNILYVMYPYFWARHARWVSALHLTDADPDFAAFLKAGAARLQVPVRPGFERAVAHFCQFGEIWEGHDAPLIDDELYVPIVDEITESLGKPEDPPTPYPADGQPWEVTVPTALVLLQNLEEVPGIRDILTGQNVTIVKPNA